MIVYCNIDYNIVTKRGKTIKKQKHNARKIVCSYPITDIIAVKKRVLKRHFLGRSDISKKVQAFDLGQIELVKVHIIKNLQNENK